MVFQEKGNTSESEDVNKFEWVSLMAGPSHFSPELKSGQHVVGEAILAVPFRACVETLQNAEKLRNRIVIVERGDCTFVQKARAAQKAGALGVIVCDNTPDSSGEFLPMFAMSGDSYNNIEIPVVFLYSKEFNRLLQALLQNPHMNVQLMQMMDFKRLQSTKNSIYNSNYTSTSTASIKDLDDDTNEMSSQLFNTNRFNHTATQLNTNLEKNNQTNEVQEAQLDVSIEADANNISSSNTKSKSKENDEL